MVAEISSGLDARLEKLRLRLGLTVTEFAEKADVKGSSMSLILRGVTKNPGINVFISLSNNTNANLMWMLSGEGEMLTQGKEQKAGPDLGSADYIIQQMNARIDELKDQVENLKYTVNLQRQMMALGDLVNVGKFEGVTVKPLCAEVEQFEKMIRVYLACGLKLPNPRSIFFAQPVAKLVAPR